MFTIFNKNNYFFQNKFNVTPNALVSSEHMVVGQIHDATTIWLETTSASQFKVCLREMQNFDGLHDNIHVVMYFSGIIRVKRDDFL